jgi:translation initiation factor 2 alpha subunit (eIF-2alpha)
MTDAISSTAVGTIVGILGLLAGVIGATIRATWQIADLKAVVAEKVNDDMVTMRKELEMTHDNVMKKFGDSFTAHTDKVRENELWNRDNFVRRSEFDRAIDGIAVRMDAGFAKIEGKIDKLQGRS